MALRRFTIALLFSILTGILAACGTTQPAAGGATAAPTVAAPTIAPAPTAMPEPTAAVTPTAAMAGMDHGSMAMVDAPFDALFIDSMIIHHTGAVTMAKQAQSQAERSEIKQLAAAIISAQEAEIAQMKQWRSMWYPDLAPTNGMGMAMGAMEVPAGNTPFDQRFIEAMIPHHESAIMMATEARQKAGHPEIKQLSEAIIAAQEAEITQMIQWLKDWYGIMH